MALSYPVNQLNEVFPILFSIIILITLSFLSSSCSSSSDNIGELKFNPSLKHKITEAEQNNPEELIPVLIKSSEELTPEMKENIEKTGLTIESIIGQIFTAKGTAKQIKETASLSYILELELSQTRELK